MPPPPNNNTTNKLESDWSRVKSTLNMRSYEEVNLVAMWTMYKMDIPPPANTTNTLESNWERMKSTLKNEEKQE